jgi:hypothetical protein
MIQNWATYDWPVIRRGDAVLQIRWKAPTSINDPTLTTVDLSTYAGLISCDVWTHDATGARDAKVGDAVITPVDLGHGRFNVTLGSTLTAALPLDRPAFYDVLFASEASPSAVLAYRLSGRIIAFEGNTQP